MFGLYKTFICPWARFCKIFEFFLISSDIRSFKHFRVDWSYADVWLELDKFTWKTLFWSFLKEFCFGFRSRGLFKSLWHVFYSSLKNCFSLEWVIRGMPFSLDWILEMISEYSESARQWFVCTVKNYLDEMVARRK